MFRNVYPLRILVFITGFYACFTAFGQSENYKQLEEQVYQLNNQLKFTESQALLLPVLETDSYSFDEKYQAALLLSYTYKRVYDYRSTLKYLHLAYGLADQTPKKAEYRQQLLSEEALVQFDTRHYTTSDSIMKVLARNNYQYVDTENKAKLVMQQAYLQFLNKDYARSEKTYDQAISLLKDVAACHLPMIYVKKMQLYDAMNQPAKLEEALRLSGHYADSCSIIKYHIYAYDELLKIVEKKHNPARIAATRKTLDSLNLVYDREEKIAALHEQKEAFLLKERDETIRRQEAGTRMLVFSVGGLVLLLVALLYWLLRYRNQKARTEADIFRMRAELEEAFTRQPVDLSTSIQEDEPLVVPVERAAPGLETEIPVKEVPELSKEHIPETMFSLINELSGRQKEVLQCMLAGMSNKEIADKLSISNNTVKYHIKNIYVFLEIKDRKDFLISVKR